MPQLEIRKFSTTIYKDKSANDAAQIPAGSATIAVYKQGASVSATATVLATDTTVSVRNIGRLVAADNLQLGTDDTKTMTVVSITNDTTVVLRRTSGTDIALAVDNRLVITTNRPTVYADSMAGVAKAASPSPLTDSAGFIEFYAPDTRFDFIASGSGVVAKLFIDNESGWMRGGVAWVNVKDYSTFQAGLNALSSSRGGVLYVPAGAYNQSTTPAVGAMVPAGISGRLKILGDGVAKTQVAYTADANTDLLSVTGFNFLEIEGIEFAGAAASGSGRGLVLNGCSYARITNCLFIDFPSWSVETTFTATDNVDNYFDECSFDNSRSNGAVKLHAQTFHTRFTNCHFAADVGNSLYINGATKTTVDRCSFEQTHDTASTDGDTAAMIYAASASHITQVHSTWFETTANNATPNNWIIFFSGLNNNSIIKDCYFVRTGAAVTSARIFKSKNVGASVVRWLTIANPAALTGGIPAGTDDLVFDASDTIIMLIGGSVSKSDYTTGTLSRNLRVSSANWPGIRRLNHNFRDKAFGLTTTDRDALLEPQAGDVIYNTTTNVLNFYNGTVWGAV